MTSSIRTRLQDDMKSALKAGETERLSTVRMALSEIKRSEADTGVDPDEALAMSIVEKMIKQRRDSEKQFRDGDRPELADKEAREIKTLTTYLPQQLSDEEVAALVDQAFKETGAADMKEMGKVMAWLKPKVAGRADMGKLSGLIKSKLG